MLAQIVFSVSKFPVSHILIFALKQGRRKVWKSGGASSN